VKTALIFGISGQDGAYLAQWLLAKGYRVVGTSRDAEASSFANLQKINIKAEVELYSASLHDFRSVLRVISSNSPDEIYNLAGQSSVGLSFDQPVETFESISIANLNLLEAIRYLNLPVRYYNAGSSECFGNTSGEGATESDPFRPRSPYAVAKAAAFWQVANYREAYDLFACSGILFNHESPLRPKRFVTQKIVAAACEIAQGNQEKLILGNIEVERDWGWAPEYVEAMWLMLQMDKPEDFIVATGECNKLKDFVEAVFQTVNLDWQDYVQYDNALIRPSEAKRVAASPRKAATELGWQARFKMRDVAQKMVHDYQESKQG
jgi:GDPmannose 4,6-dehydratase